MLSPAAAEDTDASEAAEIYTEVEDIYTHIRSLGYEGEGVQREKQISVDPISLTASSRLVLPPVLAGPKVSAVDLPLSLLPAKPKFLSSSLPNSATSSPRFSSALSKKKSRNHSQVDTHLTPQRGGRLQKSQSCVGGRESAAGDELDLWSTKEDSTVQVIFHVNKADTTGKREKKMESYEEKFKCGALCLFLPGFGKGKPVRPRKEENVISRTVSLEKFECGSWSSSAIMNENENEEDGESSMSLYFDLPVELIRSSGNDAQSPVATAFVFDKDQRKGVLKNSAGRGGGRKSHESSRHVRFSTSTPTSSLSPSSSSPSCITPRLRKARDDFNAFLEAQTA